MGKEPEKEWIYLYVGHKKKIQINLVTKQQ